MHIRNGMIYLFLVLTILLLIGMLIGSWRVILYPYLLVVGLMVLFGLWKDIQQGSNKLKSIPFIITLAYLVIFTSFDLIMNFLPIKETSYVFGLTPSMAIYILAILPSGALVCLLYALTFKNDLSTEN